MAYRQSTPEYVDDDESISLGKTIHKRKSKRQVQSSQQAWLTEVPKSLKDELDIAEAELQFYRDLLDTVFSTFDEESDERNPDDIVIPPLAVQDTRKRLGRYRSETKDVTKEIQKLKHDIEQGKQTGVPKADDSLQTEVTFLRSLLDKLERAVKDDTVPTRLKLPKVPVVALDTKDPLKKYRKSVSKIVDELRRFKVAKSSSSAQTDPGQSETLLLSSNGFPKPGDTAIVADAPAKSKRSKQKTRGSQTDSVDSSISDVTKDTEILYISKSETQHLKDTSGENVKTYSPITNSSPHTGLNSQNQLQNEVESPPSYSAYIQSSSNGATVAQRSEYKPLTSKVYIDPDVPSNYVSQLEDQVLKLTCRISQLEEQLHTSQRSLILTAYSEKGTLSRFSDKLDTKSHSNYELSGASQPTKLAQRFVRLYDEGWCDIYQYKTIGLRKTEEEAISEILELIETMYQICHRQAQEQLDDWHEQLRNQPRNELPHSLQSVTNSGRTDASSQLKKIQIDTAEQSLHFIRQVILTNEHFQAFYSSDIDHCQDFITECIEICWLMIVQEPPIHLSLSCKKGSTFDKTHYKVYKKDGSKVAYLVWPSVFLCEGGPLLQKGVIQPL